jgi:hypothetical protein
MLTPGSSATTPLLNVTLLNKVYPYLKNFYCKREYQVKIRERDISRYSIKRYKDTRD